MDPDPSLTRLRRATRAGLKAARRAPATGQGVAATGDLRRVPGPDIAGGGLVVRGQVRTPTCADAGEAFDAAF